MIKMIPQELLETVERKLAEEIVTERDLRIKEAGDSQRRRITSRAH